ncbi:MAG: hypothetical protein ACRDNZ_20480 [Streptosporangiaceae bacterium]
MNSEGAGGRTQGPAGAGEQVYQGLRAQILGPVSALPPVVGAPLGAPEHSQPELAPDQPEQRFQRNLG